MADDKNRSDSQLSAPGWIAILAMLALLGWAIWYAVTGWASMRGVHISTLGWVFFSFGIVVTILVGAGLMALVFYSSRHDLDR
ncbi:MAG TPA: hypothetical protein VG501_12010 [Rhizomicrobium sp.]|nr:hypothetical protein [Rhizomicrobium sp.]